MFEIENFDLFENALRNGEDGTLQSLIFNSIINLSDQIEKSELEFIESDDTLYRAFSNRRLSKNVYNSILFRLLDIGAVENIEKFYDSIILPTKRLSNKDTAKYDSLINSILPHRENLSSMKVYMHPNWAIIKWEADIKERERVIYADKVILNVKEIVKNNPKTLALPLLVVLALFFSKQLPNPYTVQDKNIDYPSVESIATPPIVKASKKEDSSKVKEQKKYNMDVDIKVEGNGKVGEIININGAKEVNL